MRFAETWPEGWDLLVCAISNRWLVWKHLKMTDENTPFGDLYQQHASAPKFFWRGGARFRGRWIWCEHDWFPETGDLLLSPPYTILAEALKFVNGLKFKACHTTAESGYVWLIYNKKPFKKYFGWYRNWDSFHRVNIQLNNNLVNGKSLSHWLDTFLSCWFDKFTVCESTFFAVLIR